jgi:DNA polymerase III gamma/tau subunit
MFKKKEEAEAKPEQHALHTMYRPLTLDRYLGQEPVVTRIRGMISSGKIPSAIAFFGPPSAGKTTLARIVAAEVNGKPVKQQSDFKEINAATQRGIDDVRELEKLSKFRAMGKRRFIVIDEAQQFLSNHAAAQALLKPLEEPSPDTTWIICSMEPAKFSSSTVGKAILKRCTQFVLEAPSSSDLLKQALRIAKGEKMTYVLDEERAVLKEVVRSCDQDMRVLANLMQGLQQSYDGMEKKPKLLTLDDVSAILESVESTDDKLAVDFMIAVYKRSYRDMQRVLLDIQDGFSFMKKLVWISQFVLNVEVLGNAKHPKVWWSSANREVQTAVSKLKLNLGFKAAVASKIIRVQAQAANFQMSAAELLSSEMYYLFNELEEHAK